MKHVVDTTILNVILDRYYLIEELRMGLLCSRQMREASEFFFSFKDIVALEMNKKEFLN